MLCEKCAEEINKYMEETRAIALDVMDSLPFSEHHRELMEAAINNREMVLRTMLRNLGAEIVRENNNFKQYKKKRIRPSYRPEGIKPTRADIWNGAELSIEDYSG